MSSERRLRLWGQVIDHTGGAGVTVDHVCAVAAVAVDSSAVALVRLHAYANDRRLPDVGQAIVDGNEQMPVPMHHASEVRAPRPAW